MDSKKWRNEVGNVSAEIKETKALIVSEHEATAIELTEISSTLDGAKANIDELKQTTIKQGEKLSLQSDAINSLGASLDLTNNNVDAVNKNVKANANAINSLSTKVEKQGDDIESISSSLNHLDTTIDSVNAHSSVTSSTQSLATIKNALNTDNESVERRKNDGKNQQEIHVVAENMVKLSAGLGDAKGEIIDLKQVVIKQGESLETQSNTLTQLSSSIDDVNNSVKNNASSINQMSTKVTQQGEKISAQADAINSINTNIGEVSAQVTDVSKAVQDTNGKLSAYRTMKVQVDDKGQQYIAGMTMGVENTDEGIQSNVVFLQDRFSIMNAAGGDPQVIFTTHGNQVIINDTAIGRGSITDAHIKDGSITNAKISNIIQSDNFVDGKKGWQLSKDTGTLKAVNADISGKLQATSGQLNNVVINENCEIKGTLNVAQVKGNILSAKNYVRDVHLGFGFNPPLNSVHIMTVEGNGCWQTLCFAGTTRIECTNGNESEVTLQFLFNNQFSFNINQFINNGKIDNLCVPVPPLLLGSRINIQLIGERSKHSFVSQCKVSFNSLTLLMNNSNGFLD